MSCMLTDISYLRDNRQHQQPMRRQIAVADVSSTIRCIVKYHLSMCRQI